MSHDNDIPNDPDSHDISDIYQLTRSDEPSAALDAAILAQAEAAVEIKRKRPAWIAPVGLAATVLLGVNLAVNLKDYSNDPAIFSETERPMVQSTNDDGAEELADSAQEAEGYNELRQIPLPGVQPVDAMQSEPIESKDTVDTVSPTVTTARQPLARRTPSSSRPDAGSPAVTTASEVRAESSTGLADFESSPGRANQQEAELNAKRAAENTAAAVVRKEQRAARVEAQERKREAERPIPYRAPRSIASSEPPTTKTDRSAPPAIVVVTPEGAVKVAGDATSTLAFEPPSGAQTSAFPERPTKAEESESDDSGIEETVVTGSMIEDIDDSPHQRLTARDQVVSHARERTVTTLSNSGDADDSEAGATAKPETRAPVYACDLNALGIDTEAIESAKVAARTVEPPLNALTWPAYIRELANEGDYVSACTHLAAYQRLFPDVAVIERLPVTIPGTN